VECDILHIERKRDPSVVMVEIPFNMVRTRDPHNYCGTVVKAIIDGLVLAGAWPDDTPDQVGHMEPFLTLSSPYVWVHIFDAETYVLSPEGWKVAQ
jgi:hypothetical protein